MLANTMTSLANHEDIIRKPVIRKQFTERINKSANRNKFEFYIFLITNRVSFKLVYCQVATLICVPKDIFNQFAQNNFNLVCKFWILQEKNHNSKQRLSSKRYYRNSKNIFPKSNEQ